MDINTNKIALLVNGREYIQFSEISVKRNIEAISSSFEFVATNETADIFPFKVYDDCTVTVNGKTVITGYINRIRPSYSNTSHSINILGNDITRDIVDSEIYNNSQISEAKTFTSLIETVLESNGIEGITVFSLIDDPPLGTEESFTASETGTTIFDYIKSIANKRQVLLTTDGQGRLIIYRNEVPEQTNLSLINKVNRSNNIIKSAESDINYTNRYKTIKIFSQSGIDTSIQGEAIDNTINRNRVKSIVSDLIYNQDDCKNLATWEINKRRANSIIYNCIVAGFWAKNNVIFEPNQYFTIEDDYCNISNVMLLKNLEYKYSETSGSITNLSFVSADAYTLSANAVGANKSLGGALA